MIDELWETMEAQAREHPEVALLHERLGGDVKLVGLTGGIGCGKSTVSGILRELGLPVIDADQIARDVVRPGEPAYLEIVRRFGQEILDESGSVDRERLGSLVFADGEKRKVLEAITHPFIFRAIADEVHRLSRERKAKVVVVDAALLFESGLSDSMDANIVVSVPEDVQVSRLMARDGISEESAREKIAAQMPTTDKVEKADHVIDNSGGLLDTRAAVLEMFSH
ncbi:MAG TPA: dephospho-CoA kinase [bacterium]|nr:dephospho-CoA kinase [bacterium]